MIINRYVNEQKDYSTHVILHQSSQIVFTFSSFETYNRLSYNIYFWSKVKKVCVILCVSVTSSKFMNDVCMIVAIRYLKYTNQHWQFSRHDKVLNYYMDIW